MAPQPVVTGLSPKEGPPGTRVIIRGEFLGTRVQDLIGIESISSSSAQHLYSIFSRIFRSQNMRLRLSVVGGMEVT